MYQDIENILDKDRRKVGNNTYLYRDVGHITMTLHGNTIAKYYPDYIKLYDGGWQTRTTKDRLCFVLRLAKIPVLVYQRDWIWYLRNYTDERCVFRNGMSIPYDGKI